MKIWCLKCGNIIDETDSCGMMQRRCDCCGETIVYSVDDNMAYIASLDRTQSLINKEILVQNCYRSVV